MNYRNEYHEIGEIFEKDGKTLKVVHKGGCDGCFFQGYYGDCDCTHMMCSALFRFDNRGVIFVEVQE